MLVFTCVLAVTASAAGDTSDSTTAELTQVPPPPVVSTSVSLLEALALAKQHASDVRIARDQTERADAAQRTALAALLPSFTGNLSLTRWDKEIARSGIVVRRLNTVGGSLNATENLSLRSWNAYRSAGVSADAAELDLKNAHRLMLASVASAYFAELASERNATLARSQLTQADRQYRAVKARLDAGVALAIDASRAELAVLDAARRVSDADAALARNQDLLGQAIGLDEPVAATEAPAPEAGDTVESYVTRALTKRPDLRSAKLAKTIADYAIDDAWFRFAPSLGITWQLTWTPQTTTFQPNPTQWSAVATLSVPIFDGGARYGALRDARAAFHQSEERIRALTRSIRNDIRDAHRRVETASRAFDIAQRSVDVARLSAEQAEAAYN
ncbi:MAG: TolC family protein, partial [Myxococcales bacterium]|nr:TolC family protein [Myxococcales bacterium]